MVNNSVNLPQSKDRLGSTRSDCKIAPCFTCPACLPSNTIHHLEEPAHTACSPVSLNLRGFLTSPQNQHTPLQVSLELFNIENHLPDSNRSLFPSETIPEAHWLRNPDT
ncbi:hypothetical protein ILYODFUR_010984, partial [Ilyodon furcidens]